MATPTATKKPTQPWKPASLLVAEKRPGYRAKWVRKDLLEKRMAEGWEPRRVSNPEGVAPNKTITDGSPMGAYVTKRGLILCDMPEELAQSRTEYFQKMSKDLLGNSSSEYEGKISKVGDGASTYGSIKIEQGGNK